MKFIWYSIQTLFVLALLGVVGLFMLPYLPIDTNVELRIVQSGSMEPAISTGSLILVWPQAGYGVGDVIMFEDGNASVPTTHRIVDVVEDGGVTRFVTQGDANEDPDNALVAKRDIYGAVAFSVPKAGFVLDFARQPIGFALLIVLPALLLIFGEIEKIWQELRRRPVAAVQVVAESIEEPSTKSDAATPTRTTLIGSSKMMDIMTPVRFHLYDTLDLRGAELSLSSRSHSIFTPGTVAVLVGVFGITAAVLATQYVQLGSTYSYFTDTEVSEDNSLQAIALDFSAVADGETFTFENGQLLGDVDGSVVTTVMPTTFSEPTRHGVSVEYVSGSEAFCDAIAVTSDEPVSYDGSLTSLDRTDIVFEQPWSVGFALPDESGLVDGDTCMVEVVLSAWHIDEENEEGYSDEERVPLSFVLSSPASVTTSLTTLLSNESRSLQLLSQSGLVVEDSKEEAPPQNRIVDESQSSDSEDGPAADTAAVDIEKKPEELPGEDDDTETVLDEAGNEENEAETPEEDLVGEEAVKQADENAEEEIDEEDVAEEMAAEEDVSETAEVQEEEEIEEEAAETVEEEVGTAEKMKEEVAEEAE